MSKKEIRFKFRSVCLSRDKYMCAMCGFKSKNVENLEVHHIQNRKIMPSGGYCLENGITLCSPCHQKAEEFHSTGISHPGYSPEELYLKIKSNYELALSASNKLKSKE